MWQQKVRSICPVCDGPVEGLLYEEAGGIFLRKACPEHGEVRDLISSDPGIFKGKLAIAPEDRSGKCSLEQCGEGIFACREHVGRWAPISFIEVTPRCNLNCPVCYIDASTRGQDVPLPEIRRMIGEIKKHDPETHLILIGGEPTIHQDFFGILQAVREAGLMKRCYLATNGLMMSDEDFARRVRETGLRWFYLAFDSTDKEVCKKIRGSYRSYEAPRKTIENLRKMPGLRTVLSITVVKGLNDRDLPRVIDFALENNDVVRRISISAEVFCGRQTTTADLLQRRVTLECIENILRRELGVGAATLSLGLYGVMLRPLKLAGVLPSGTWVHTVPHPLCGGVGAVGKNSDGSYYSLIDLVMRDPGRNLYRFGKKMDELGKEMEREWRILQPSVPGRMAWKLLAWLYYLPAYFLTLLRFIRPSFIFRALSAAVKSIFTGKKMKDLLLGRPRVELHYLFCCDKYNFIWERMPYCLTHHYRIDPQRGKVAKLCGCFVIPFRSYAESCQTMG